MPSPEAVDSVSAELAALIHDVSRRLRVTAHTEANIVPLPDSERDVLRLIHRRPGVSASAVALELRMKHSNVSTAVRNLVAHGLVAREVDQRDRRVARLTVTDLAEQNIQRLERNWDEHLGAALDRLEPGYRGALEEAVPALRALLAVMRT